ncbi:MAG TPA: alpha/beta hydrolase [Planctomycetaceae bacterium]|jgi:arylformamidase|nr:alpha/beta hydrolase [Planctomycetaceae bacterium]
MMLDRQFATQEEIDKEYDVEKSVPDFRRYADFNINEGRKARDELECLLDVPFGPTVEETLDIFPAQDPDAPILVFIHGGYWRSNSSKEFSWVARGPSALGFTVVITNYALCPKVTLPEITRQSRAAIAWIQRSSKTFSGSRRRIYLAGHSAGGHQVAMLLHTRWMEDYGLPRDVIRGGFAISGLFDLRPLRFSWLQPKLQLTEDIVRTQSPLLRLPDRAPPLFVSVGGAESCELRRQSADYLLAWKAAGLRGCSFEQPEANHFTAIAGFFDKESKLCASLKRLVETCEAG